MWKFTFCPQFRVMSFTFFMVNVDLLFWVLTLIMTAIDGRELNAKVFLGPNPVVLNRWGAKNPYEMQQHYQLWRFVTPALLSNGFS